MSYFIVFKSFRYNDQQVSLEAHLKAVSSLQVNKYSLFRTVELCQCAAMTPGLFKGGGLAASPLLLASCPLMILIG